MLKKASFVFTLRIINWILRSSRRMTKCRLRMNIVIPRLDRGIQKITCYMNLSAYKHGERDISLPEYLDYPVKPDNDREASNNARYLYLLQFVSIFISGNIAISYLSLFTHSLPRRTIDNFNLNYRSV